MKTEGLESLLFTPAHPREYSWTPTISAKNASALVKAMSAFVVDSLLMKAGSSQSDLPDDPEEAQKQFLRLTGIPLPFAIYVRDVRMATEDGTVTEDDLMKMDPSRFTEAITLIRIASLRRTVKSFDDGRQLFLESALAVAYAKVEAGESFGVPILSNSDAGDATRAVLSDYRTGFLEHRKLARFSQFQPYSSMEWDRVAYQLSDSR